MGQCDDDEVQPALSEPFQQLFSQFLTKEQSKLRPAFAQHRHGTWDQEWPYRRDDAQPQFPLSYTGLRSCYRFHVRHIGQHTTRPPHQFLTNRRQHDPALGAFCDGDPKVIFKFLNACGKRRLRDVAEFCRA